MTDTAATERRELERWSKELPAKCGWYYMRYEGQEPLKEGLIVWVGHNRSGVRYEGQFFSSGSSFLRQREFLGPITIEAVNSHVGLEAERDALREALEEIVELGRQGHPLSCITTGGCYVCIARGKTLY